MESKKDLSEKWKNILNLLSNEFNKGDVLDIESVIYLIGVCLLYTSDAADE